MDKSLEQEIEEILKQHREWMRGIRTDRLIGASDKESKLKLLHLFNTHCQKREEQTYIDAVAVGMARAKTAVTIMMNTGKTSMKDLRQGIDDEIEAWNRIMTEGDQLKQTSIKEREQ